MPTPDDQIVKGFQRLIAPSADADDGVDYADATDDTDATATGTVPQRHRELLRRARDILREQGSPMPGATLAQQVFGAGESMSGGAWVLLLTQMLRTSAAFACDTAGNWRLTVWDASMQRLDEMEFVALDVESTGLAPGRHRILEVAAVIVRNGEPGAHFQRLINPAARFPSSSPNSPASARRWSSGRQRR